MELQNSKRFIAERGKEKGGLAENFVQAAELSSKHVSVMNCYAAYNEFTQISDELRKRIFFVNIFMDFVTI